MSGERIAPAPETVDQAAEPCDQIAPIGPVDAPTMRLEQLGPVGQPLDVAARLAVAREQVRPQPIHGERGRFVKDNPGRLGTGDRSTQLEKAYAPITTAI